MLSSWPGGGESQPIGKCFAGFICALLAQQLILLFLHSWFSSHFWLMIHREHVFHSWSFIQHRDRACTSDSALPCRGTRPARDAAGTVGPQTHRIPDKKEPQCVGYCRNATSQTVHDLSECLSKSPPGPDFCSNTPPPHPPATSHVPAPVDVRCEGRRWERDRVEVASRPSRALCVT